MRRRTGEAGNPPSHRVPRVLFEHSLSGSHAQALAQSGAVLAHRSRHGVPPGRALFLVGLDRVRFRRPVVPGDQLFLEVIYVRRRGTLWKLHGTARVSDQIVAEADLSGMDLTTATLADTIMPDGSQHP
jgi:acyl dehydratase